ncbi:hypothetical protein [Ectobacillus polymachus]
MIKEKLIARVMSSGVCTIKKNGSGWSFYCDGLKIGNSLLFFLIFY